MTSRILFAIFCFLTSQNTMAQMQSSKLKPLHFQADKNNLQVLPQRFEYSLSDEGQLQIGDILINTNEFQFKLIPSDTKDGFYKIHFSWPASLIKEGRLAIKNNSGKAIYNTILNRDNIQVTSSSNNPDTSEFRSETAEFTTDEVESSLIENMKYLPFMNFCILKESEDSRLYLCSKELYLSKQDKELIIKGRAGSRNSARIEINGKTVGQQGIIYLNDRSETVVFRAQTINGASLEIETRKKDVTFKDVVLAKDKEFLILTASGAEPASDIDVTKISDSDWQIKLPKSRPVLFLKGDSDIPMRQEFYIKGPLPEEKYRPYVSAKSPDRTYSSSLSLAGIYPAGVSLKNSEANKSASLKTNKKNRFLWTLTEIPPGVQSRHYLAATVEGRDISVAYDIYRGQPYELSLGLRYLTPAQLTYATVSFQMWFENFLAQNANWSRFHWGFNLERQQHLNESQDFLKTDMTTLELIWRAQAGFHLADNSWGLTIPLQYIQVENESITAFGAGVFWSSLPPSWLRTFMDWSEVKFTYLAGSTDGTLKLSSAYNLNASAYWNLKSEWYLRYGVEMLQYKFNPAASKEKAQLGLNLGAFWKF